MDWTPFDAMYVLPYGWPLPARWPPTFDAEPTEADLWMTGVTYELIAGRSECGRCGAAFGSRLNLTVFRDPRGEKDTLWQIGVRTRCRGWRRHRHTAIATERRGELLLGKLRPS